MNRRPVKLDVQARAQVVSLHRAGFMPRDICHRLGLERPGELEAVRLICDTLPRRSFYMPKGKPQRVLT